MNNSENDILLDDKAKADDELSLSDLVEFVRHHGATLLGGAIWQCSGVDHRVCAASPMGSECVDSNRANWKNRGAHRIFYGSRKPNKKWTICE